MGLNMHDPLTHPTIGEFRIRKLFGSFNVRVPVRDNKIVLVGSNGLGKTTIVNMLYATLTKQWARLVEYQFDALAVDIGSTTIQIEKQELERAFFSKGQLARWRRVLPTAIARRIEHQPDLLHALVTGSQDALKRTANQLGLPLHVVIEIADDFAHAPSELVQRTLFDDKSPVQAVAAKIDTLLDGQVVYLPTYRRIERDLQALFPNVERSFDERARKPAADTYVEFVEFGMKDVEQSFERTLARLKETARSELNRLAATYLREVIAGEGERYDKAQISRLTEQDINRIIGRIEEKTLLLPESEKVALRNVIGRIQSGDDAQIGTQQHYVAHFFMKLMDVDLRLRVQEEPIVEAARVCSRYLEGKELWFDETKYEAKIRLKHGDALPFANLSSGEKQIVSLFTHIYLGTEKKLLMIIDEPELSLSVDWQRRLLPDILASGRCQFLAAVTHSPFIFDNELESYALDLRECVSSDEG